MSFKKRWWIVISIIMISLLVVTACSTSSTDSQNGTNGTSQTDDTAGNTTGDKNQEVPKTKHPKVARMVLPLDGEMLEPHVFTWGTYYARMGIFEPLTKIDKDMNVIPANATSWEHNDDYTVWTFKLRDDLKWSDGTTLNAHDYEYSFKRVVNPATAAEYGKGSAFITGVPILNAEEIRRGEKDPDSLGVKTLDDLTLEVTMSKPWPNMPLSVSEIWAVPVPKHVIEKYGQKWIEPQNIVSNGPYKVEDFQLGVHLKLVPNPEYYGKINLDRVEVIKLENQILPYQNDDINIASLQAADMDMVAKDPELTKQMQFYKTGVVYFMNILMSENDILQKNPKIRQAISMSLQRNIIADDIMRGSVRAAPSMIPEIFAPWGLEIGLGDNQQRARELMAEAGYPDGKGIPEMTIIIAGEATGRELAIADMIEKGTGIKTKIVNYEWAKFVEERDKLHNKDTFGYFISGAGSSINHYSGYIRREDLWNVGRALLPPDKFKKLKEMSEDKSIDPAKKGQMLNDFIYENTTEVGKQYISLIRESLASSDPQEQEQLDKEAAKLREQEAVYIPIDWENGVKLIKPYLKGYVGNPLLLGAPPLYFNDLYVEE